MVRQGIYHNSDWSADQDSVRNSGSGPDPRRRSGAYRSDADRGWHQPVSYRIEDTNPESRFADRTRQPASPSSIVPPAGRGEEYARARAERYAEARLARNRASNRDGRVRYTEGISDADSVPSPYARTSRGDFTTPAARDPHSGSYAAESAEHRNRKERILINDESYRMDKVTAVRNGETGSDDRRLESGSPWVSRGWHPGAGHDSREEAPGRNGASGGRARRASGFRQPGREVYAKRDGNAWHSKRRASKRRIGLVVAAFVILVVAVVVLAISNCTR